ncbi:MAG: hypothetical protein O6857_00015 [Nitrospinae bacterium]|nr:hypothetical protein [Nitrospinota bacterium]
MTPLLPYFLVYLSGILAALPASQNFLFPLTKTPYPLVVNVFHHPHPQVVDRYRRHGATLWRTDLQGAIRITTNGTDTRITHHKDL